MSYGEATATPNAGRFIALANEVIALMCFTGCVLYEIKLLLGCCFDSWRESVKALWKSVCWLLLKAMWHSPAAEKAKKVRCG